MSSVILNSQDHSIADLPLDILEKMFKDLRGSVLIRLTTVCRAFNSVIGESKPLMNKIRLRVRKSDIDGLDELEEILCNTKRRYEHLAFTSIQRDHASCEAFIKKRRTWSSLRLSTCSFDSLSNQILFLSYFKNLAEIEFDNHIDSHHLRRGDPIPSINIPTLKKLKVGLLTVDFNCQNLISLEVTGSHDSCATNLLIRNPGLEELRLSYESLETIFGQPHSPSINSLRIKRLTIKRLNSSEGIPESSIINFERFLKSQSNFIEELTLDWFSGIPPRIRPASNRHRNFRLRRNHEDDDLLFEEIPPVLRRNFDQAEDACLRTLAIVFSEFFKLNKLVIGDKHSFLTNASVPSVDGLEISPSFSITELRLRFEKTSHSDKLFKKFITACPRVTSLFAHAMDQQLLEFCAEKLPDLETLFALSLKVQSLPDDKSKFEKLQRLNFVECFIESKPEIRELKLFDRKNLVLGFLTGKSAVK